MKNQLEKVSLGQLALVRCVSSVLYSGMHRKYQLFPVLPILPYEPHSDAKIIQFPDLHLHYDYRFWSDKLIEEVSYSIYKTPDDWPSRVQLEEDVINKPFLKKMVCVKQMPFMASYYDFMPDLEEAYQNHVLVDDICPHQGYKTFPSSIDGCHRICPGHGLGFRDGKVCSRLGNNGG